jgi:hypothetical protein
VVTVFEVIYYSEFKSRVDLQARKFSSTTRRLCTVWSIYGSYWSIPMAQLRILHLISHSLLILLLSAEWAAAVAGRPIEPASDAISPIEHCLAKRNGAARPRCAGDITVSQAQSDAVDNWRLVRTPNPTGGRDAISIMRTADIPGSDVEFAGIMLRCNHAATEVLIVLLRALPPQTHTGVAIEAGTTTTRFTASVVSPGVLLLLPPEASALASGPWQTTAKLAITIDGGDGPIRGAITLAGLSGAMQKLQANCLEP